MWQAYKGECSKRYIYKEAREFSRPKPRGENTLSIEPSNGYGLREIVAYTRYIVAQELLDMCSCSKKMEMGRWRGCVSTIGVIA